MKLGYLIIIVGAAWVLCWIALGWGFGDFDGSGDVFSAINSLFSALAFAVIIYTISLQKKELALQRKELADTRKEFEVQNQTLRKQRFESTFFNLLSLHHSIIEKISVPAGAGTPPYNSRDAIKFVHEEFKGVYIERLKRMGNPEVSMENVMELKSMVTNAFSSTYQRYEPHISHLIKNFVALIRLIKSSELIVDSERELYYSILRSQITSYEISFLFYHFNAGFGMEEKVFFDDSKLGGAMNPEILADLRHSYLFDPAHVVEAAIRARGMR